jgi:hypothetical protein
MIIIQRREYISTRTNILLRLCMVEGFTPHMGGKESLRDLRMTESGTDLLLFALSLTREMHIQKSRVDFFP